MLRRRELALLTGAPLLATIVFACGGDPEIATGRGEFGDGAAGAGGAHTDGSGATGNIVIQPDGSAGSGGDGGGDACSNASCGADQHCELLADGGAACVGNTCEMLGCSPTQLCIVTDGGALCEDNSCESDVGCDPSRYCDTSAVDGGGGICVDDVCTAADARCDGQSLLVCDPNGGGETSRYSCGSGSPYFTSLCDDAGGGVAGCPCEDDWDCPRFTECEVATCAGTGEAPTCRLPPEPFANVLPASEIEWGGTGIATPSATGSPFEQSAQAVMAPVVINLDDDNGDGLIDERDFPEILFTTFCNQDLSSNGVLRAIHGGGPNKGADAFAACGTNVWRRGDALPATCDCVNDGDLDSTASLAAGDLDGDGVPEIVAITEGSNTGSNNGALRIYDNTGAIISTGPSVNLRGSNPGPSLANVDNAGFVEIVVGRIVFTLTKDAGGALQIADQFEGTQAIGTQGQGPVSCVANLVGDSKQEIVAGSTVYSLPRPPAGATRRSDCGTNPPSNAEETAYCNGELVVVWDGQAVNGATAVPNAQREGFCAIADILGADQLSPPGPTNPLDGVAEVIVVSNTRLMVYDGQTGELRFDRDYDTTDRGGPPNVDDFDGDGFPEVSSAFSTSFVMMDLQAPTTGGECDDWPNPGADASRLDSVAGNPPRSPPAQSCTRHSDCGDPSKFGCNVTLGQCVCLYNGWRRTTEDDSSRVTGSSVFDFNGDGAAEVIYNDECYFRVYDGTDGTVYFKERSPSRTRIEYPIVADVDNDGNAEIVFATSNESGFCNDPSGAGGNDFNNGIEVWGDANDLWVSARRVWNQHAYHVTNVTEGGRIPAFEPESWRPMNGRLYNTYRSQPRSQGVAPDLTPTAIQITSPDASCGQLSNLIDITVEIRNVGDLRVGPGVVVSFHGEWTSLPLSEALRDGSGQPLVAVLGQSLEPGDVVQVTVRFAAANNAPGTLPDRVRVVVDDGDRERECIESNNTLEADVDPGNELPDLRLDVGTPSGCPTPAVPMQVCNDGSLPTADVVIRCYAGNPSSGGAPLDTETVAGPIAPGACVMHTQAIDVFPRNLDVLLHCTADPDGTIAECNDGNNTDAADRKHFCPSVQ